MNVRDSEALLGLLMQNGFSVVDHEKKADVILINTCSVREHAEHRVDSLLGHFKKLIERNKTKRNVVIGIIGCMAKNKGKEIFKKWEHVGLIVAPAHLHKIPKYLEELRAAGCRLWAGHVKCKISEIKNSKDCQKSPEPRTQSLGRLRIIDVEDGQRDEEFYSADYREKTDHADVVISTGCSNHCAYCVVPHVRGELRLRAPEDIIAEVKRNVAMGRTRITLLGQNVNDYNYKLCALGSGLKAKTPSPEPRAINFVDLLGLVDGIDGVEWIEFLTAHPKNTSKKLFELMAGSKKINKYLHLPFQAGSDRILKLMRRGYTLAQYLKLARQYKKITGGTLGTDIIVGFPTETDADFKKTREMLEKVCFKNAFIFKYSPRPGTPASKMPDDVPGEVKEERHSILFELQKKLCKKA